MIGAGIAGLSAAWRLRNRDILVLEADRRVGGRILSTETPTGILNFGAHMLGGPGTPVGDLCAELGLRLRPIDAGLMAIAYDGRLRLKGRPEFLPFLLPLSPLARLSLVRAGLDLRLGSASASKMLRRTENGIWQERTGQRFAFAGDETLAARLGRLHPQTEAIIRAITERCGGDPGEISAGHGLRSFANVWSSAAPGFHLIGGSSRLPEAIATQLRRRLLLETPAHSVVRHKNMSR
nr:FAD-dependent oxidoreductase [Marinicella sp. W31]MDC2879572.1 FAD-dependent oxidoreductase [Marinicella sp. W31]